jgi:aconitate hydratase 2/2-methylisocitrate dehydratase
MQPGVTLRDLVNAIPWIALKSGDLTVAKQGKKNVFSGRIIEIEGLPDLKVEQAFELSDATAERSAAGCTIRLGHEPIKEYLKSNVVMLRWMIAQGYGDAMTIGARARAMEAWLAEPVLLEPDADARYYKVFEIDLAEIQEPLLACPNDPDDVKTLSEVAGTPIDEVFLGSCMTNIGHFRAASRLLEDHGEPVPTRMWVAPPTKMDKAQLMQEGHYNSFALAGARTEVPGCSLCMGNQARVRPNSTVISTSTRNFPNRLGKGANVFLGSAELASVAAILGRLPTREEYLKYTASLDPMADEIYRYLNFNELAEYTASAEGPNKSAGLRVLQ